MDSNATRPTRIEVRLLGRFGIEMDGAVRPAGGWGSRRARELVQLLALQPQRELLHDQAVEALWPQLDPRAGSANLRKAAHLARQSLAMTGAVVLRGGRVVLWSGCTVDDDMRCFEQAADAAVGRGDRAGCAAAAALYGGDLLPDACYASWAQVPRQRLRDKFLLLLREADDLERLVREEPTDEAAHQALMRRALAAGQRSNALRWYGQLRDHLAQSLGVQPSRESAALYAECLAGLRSAAAGFVGRSVELAQATAWLRAGAAARAGALVLRAPAGMGKSAFCRRLGEEARALGCCVHELDAAQAARPYGLVVDLVEPLLLADRSLLQAIGPHAHGVLAALTPAAAPAPPLPGPISRHQVVGAVGRLLLAAAAQRATLVLADDMHLADDGSAEVLLQLAAANAALRVLIATRPGPKGLLERAVARMLRTGRLEVIELGPLAADEAASLAAQTCRWPLAPAQAAQLVAPAEGHPFVVVELAHAVRQPADTAPGSLVGSGLAAIVQRLCDVDAPTLAALRRLAVVGGALDTAAAVVLVADDEAEACERLDRVLADEVLMVVQGRYRFRHPIVQQALVDALPPHQRLGLHRDVAAALARAAVAPGLVAQQWLAAGDAQAALPWVLAAAREAQRLGAFADLRRLLEPLLARLPAQPDALALWAEALDALGDPGTLAAYDAAAAVASEADAHDLRAKRALAQVKASDRQGALRALEGVHPTTVAGRLAEALALSGAAALGYGDPAAGTRKAAQCRRLALQSGDTGALVFASWAQAAAAHARGELHSSVWADLQETSHLPQLALRVFDGHLCITQRFLYGSRPYADVIAFADALAAEAQRVGAARGQAFAVTLRGEALLLSGQLDAAEQDLLQGGRMHRVIGGATGEALSLQRRAELALYRDQPARARALLDEALDVARQCDVGFHLLDRIYGTRIALAREPDAALAVLEEADDAVRGPFETCPGCRITFAVPATIAAARAHDLDLAAGHERQAEYLANVVMRLPAWHAALHEARAHIAQASGERQRAARGFEAAAQGFRGAGQPLDAARCSAHAAGLPR